MVCVCGSDACTCRDQCLCNSCACTCWPCQELRMNLTCSQCGHRMNCVTRLRYPMPLPDLSFLKTHPTAGTSGESAKPDEPGKPGSKNLSSEERKELYSQPMIFQMDDIDSSPDERVTSLQHQLAAQFVAIRQAALLGISIRSLPDPCIVVSQHDESVSEQAQDAPSDTSSKCSESLPSGLSDESLPSSRVPSPESPKSQLATSAPPSFSASPPRIKSSPERSASALPKLCQTSSTSNLDTSIAQHVQDVEIASDTSSSIETLSMDPSNEMSLEEKLAAFKISTFPPLYFGVVTASEQSETKATSLEQCTEMSLKEQSAAVDISNPQFKEEICTDSSSSVETCTETTSLDEESPLPSVDDPLGTL